jgi:hypothetical protein
MKVKHCFYFILFILVVGSLSLALSVSPYFKSSLKSFNKDAGVSAPKNNVRVTERETNFLTVADAASSSRTPSPPITGPLNAHAPAIRPAADSASPQSDLILAAELKLCQSELKNFQSIIPAKDYSKDDLQAQLQEVQFKLKAAEEEIQSLQVHKPPQEEGNAGGRCHIIERESVVCKSELRVVRSKVFLLNLLPSFRLNLSMRSMPRCRALCRLFWIKALRAKPPLLPLQQSC